MRPRANQRNLFYNHAKSSQKAKPKSVFFFFLRKRGKIKKGSINISFENLNQQTNQLLLLDSVLKNEARISRECYRSSGIHFLVQFITKKKTELLKPKVGQV